ncbi:MAG: hypothetical protein V3W18_15060 [candidate division Zixibacteria bacterium]
MDFKKVIIATIVVFIALVVTELIIHSGILGGSYGPLAEQGVFRPDDQMKSYMWVMIINGLVFSFFFVFIFAKGYEGKGCAEGIRYGIYIGFFWIFVNSFNSFAIYQIPYSLVWYWIIFGFIQTIIYGIIASLIYKPKTA